MTRGRNERRRINAAAREEFERIWYGFAIHCAHSFSGQHMAAAQPWPPNTTDLVLTLCAGCKQPIQRRWSGDGNTLTPWSLVPYRIQEEP